ncbi:collagenase [Streptomyces sp. NPDC058700]|uniref:collagenase n=2 Tax=unclassified Streptomyces TaxID=2593676 RepID=UPI003654E7AB
MSQHRSVRSALLAPALAVGLLLPLGQTAGAAAAPRTSPTVAAAWQPHPYDEVERLASAPPALAAPAPAPGGATDGRIPGAAPDPADRTHAAATDSAGRTPGAVSDPAGRLPGVVSDPAARPPRAHRRAAAAPCTLDGVTGLTPERFADFLADPAVTADGCLRGLVWTWDARLAPVMSDAHVQAVARRATTLAPGHDGKNSSHLEEMFTYLHAVAYHDFSRDEIDTTDAPTVDAVRRAVAAHGTAPRTFDVTPTNADTLREALYAASAPGLRQHQLPLIRRTLATMDAAHPATHLDPAWAGAALAALSLNYLGVYPGNQDTAFHAAAAADPAYRAAFKAFSGYGHLKDTANSWVARDALGEYGRFGQIQGLRPAVVADLGALLGPVERTFGTGSAPWASLVSWLNVYEACAPYGVCKADIERRIFPYTYPYDSGAIKVRTGLPRTTVDTLYYASKQVKAQFHRVLGTQEPLAGDPNTSLNIVLYASRADYEKYHPILTGMDTNNGGIYIERGATFYTYERRVPQDSSLTLEELFRHEYTHYLNGRYAVPGFFGEGPWYQGDRTTAMDEGTAEFFDGATRDDGVAVRKSLVRSVIADTAGGGPRMTVRQILHATYDGDGFRFYAYAGTFFEYLWTDRPAALREMYKHLRGNDVAAYDAWRERLGADPSVQRGYDRFLDAAIADVDRLFVPATTFTPVAQLRDSRAADVAASFAAATSSTPVCAESGEPGGRRFTCTGRVTANLANAGSADQVFKDMSETVDYFLLDRAGAASNNLADMNCSFGPVDIWTGGRAGTSSYHCEGPLRG